MKYLLLLLTIQEILPPSQSINGIIWDKSRGSFIPIFSIPVFATARQEILTKSREYETHDFRGEALKFGYYQEENVVNYYANDTMVSGICGDIWSTLAEHLNFTLRPMKTHENSVGTLINGTYIGLMGLISKKEIDILAKLEAYSGRMAVMDFTIPLWKNRQRLYVHPKTIHDRAWMLKPFSLNVWYTTLITHLLLTICGFISQRMSAWGRSKVKVIPFDEHFFYNFAMICNQSYIPPIFRGRSRILEISLGIFSSLFNIAFGGLLFTYMARTVFVPPFSDIPNLLKDTNYDLIIFDGSIGHIAVKKKFSIFAEVFEKNRYKCVTTIEEMFTRACSPTKKYAIFEGEDIIKLKNIHKCQLNPMGAPYFETWIVSGVVKDFKYKKTINIGILKMYEVGLMTALRQHWMKTWDMRDDELALKPIGVDQVSLVFMIFGVGSFFAFLGLLIENIYFHYKYRRLK